MTDKFINEPIEWCRKESRRNAELQGDRRQTNQRRKIFRYRNHMLAKTADRLEAAEAKLRAVGDVAVNCLEYYSAAYQSGKACRRISGEIQAILKDEA